MMQALYQVNPTAFSGNINRLIDGKYLDIPSLEFIQSMDVVLSRQKSDQADSKWLVEKKPEEQSVRRKHLDAAKTEINKKLQAFGSSNKQKLETIQNDVSDSIDGLQSILKENDALRGRLTSFKNQLNTIEEEVAKSEEVKMQMDNML
jgi:pilus assembly protein FimV